MFKLLFPDAYVKSAFSIDYSKLYAMGYRGVVFDIDATLVPHGADSTAEVDDLLRRIQQTGFRTLFLSNNGEERIRRFLKNIDSLYISNADKPRPRSYHKAAEMLGLQRKEIIFVGDQIFTDILGANLSGIDSILVHYILHEGETQIGKRRKLEGLILKAYQRSKVSQKGLGAAELDGGVRNVTEKKIVL